jgi:hypothetical protein
MGTDPLDQLRPLVIDDEPLRSRLLAAPDRQAFIAAVIDVARGCGIALSADEVVEALSAARRRRQAQWV